MIQRLLCTFVLIFNVGLGKTVIFTSFIISVLNVCTVGSAVFVAVILCCTTLLDV